MQAVHGRPSATAQLASPPPLCYSLAGVPQHLCMPSFCSLSPRVMARSQTYQAMHARHSDGIQNLTSRAANVLTMRPTYRVYLQIQSNALGALEAIDPEVLDAVIARGQITGDRINGLCDGISGDWCV